MAKAANQSVKQIFTSRIKDQILAGELKAGQKLPPERNIAQSMGISRTIVHAGIAELAAQKVLRVVPRKGTYITDYKSEGTLQIYDALLKHAGRMDDEILESLIVFRDILETANARLAATNRSAENIRSLKTLLKKELAATNIDERVELDFIFHVEIAKASQNIVLPMALRSAETMYRALAEVFYAGIDPYETVYKYHRKLIHAIEEGNAALAETAMKSMLTHGMKTLKAARERV